MWDPFNQDLLMLCLLEDRTSNHSLQSRRHIRQRTARPRRLGTTPNIQRRDTVRRDYRRLV